MSIVLQGSTSGSVTLQEPAVAGTTVLDLPAVSGTILTTGSSGQSIPKAALPTGSVLQVVTATYVGSVTTSSTSYVTTGLAASITPASSSNKILIMMASGVMSSNTNIQMNLTVYRGGTNLMTQGQGLIYTNTGVVQGFGSVLYYDSPATTSSTTYTIYFKNTNNSAGNVTWNPSSASGDTTAQLVLMEIVA
jgi:hypothetical protein